MKINILPKTHLGKWSLGLIIAFFVLLASFFALVASGQRGGDTFFSNLYLTIPMLVAAIAAVTAFFTGIVSIINNRERSIIVFISTILGLLVTLYVMAEVLFSH